MLIIGQLILSSIITPTYISLVASLSHKQNLSLTVFRFSNRLTNYNSMMHYNAVLH